MIADDHPVYRKGLRQVIESDPDLRIVGEAEDGERALALLVDLQPRVAVLDIDMPGGDGLSIARALRARAIETAVLFLTMHKQQVHLNAAFDAGALGYVLKDDAVREIVDGIRAVAGGRSYVTPSMTEFLVARRAHLGTTTSTVDRLTAAERRVLARVAEYRTSAQIAEELFVSVRTVERHRGNIALKIGVTGHHAVLQFALQHKHEL